MAFRRKFRKKFSRPVARVRRTWHSQTQASLCNPYTFSIQPCSDGQAQTDVAFVLLDNLTLQDKFSDSARVKRIIGDLWWLPGFTSPPVEVGDYLPGYAALNYFQVFAGLRKRQINDAGLSFNVEPMNNLFDFAEAGWLKTWQHVNLPRQGLSSGGISGNLNFAVQCGDVHTTGAPDNILTNGSGTIDIETDCTTPNCFGCAQDAELVQISSDNTRNMWHLRVNWRTRKGIYLRENEELVLQLQFAHPGIGPYTANGPQFEVVGGIKSVLEY